MKSDTFELKAEGDVEVFVYRWLPDENVPVKGVVQIAHGMVEHAGRYQFLAKELTDSGYVVYADDHRGHGKTAGAPEKVGHFPEKDGFRLIVADMKRLTDRIKKERPGPPLFLLGHSMGSFLTRYYIIQHGEEIDGAILSGTSGDPGLLRLGGVLAAKIESILKGRAARSSLLDSLSFGSYNKEFEPTRTDSDWLSRDEAEVDKFIRDPYCGAVCTAGFFYDMLTALGEIYRFDNIRKTPADLPIYLFSGDKDPVGGKNGEGVLETRDAYRKAGVKDLSLELYENGRHEMLNEINRPEVHENIIKWLDAHI
ncbi:MAG: alpha/beta hydrolase [Desulfobacterales bacterium]|nr:alpha/beta hydrolase [Desulfobacterales bacterium]